MVMKSSIDWWADKLNWWARYLINIKLLLFWTGVKVTEVQAMVENHLKDMILKTFDPKKADTIFTEEGEVSCKTMTIEVEATIMIQMT